ncbi:MFS transporter [Actinomycetospora endophytica]|uniref:MFS transporter n=1 Tax=Actinomycetospora endophytica TaxID=2291215 RepID=A0ABS8P796_9PSEU|nr:MFS transporter [Actinomycetospora endophytica]MCD2194121.1 MFS transporter [Actinomycetospora endophytica]
MADDRGRAGDPRLTTSAALAGAPTVQFAALRPDDPGDDDPTGLAAAAVIATASAGAGLVVVDATVVNLAAPALVADLGIGGGGAQWVVEAYTVVFASLLLSAGRLGDRYGRRRCLAAGAILLAGAGALAAAAPGPAVLLVARALQGAGAALVFPATLSALGATFRGPIRGTAFALWGATIAATAGIGALLGGWLTSTLGWRAVFAAFVPVGAAIAVAARLALPESREPTGSVDLVGALLSVLGVGAGVLALVQGPAWGWWVPGVAAPAGWPVSPVPVLVVVAVGCVAAFAVRQRRLAAAGAVPLLAPRLLRIRSFRAGTAAASVIHFGEFGLMFVLPFWWQDVLGWSAAQAAVLLVFPAGAALAGGVTTSVLVRRVGPRTTVRAGLACEGAAAAGLAGVVSTGASPFALGAALLVLYGLGLGLASAQLGSIVLADLAGDDVGAGSGAMTTAQQVGAAFGVAVLGAVTFAAPALAHGVARALMLTAVALALALVATWRLGGAPSAVGSARHRVHTAATVAFPVPAASAAAGRHRR